MIKIVLFGYSKTGREIAKLVKNEDYDLQIIDENPLQVAQANEDGFYARHSIFNEDKMLKDVGIGEDVEVLFCTSTDDSQNLFITLSARNLDKNLRILTLIYKKEDEKKMMLAGANRTVNPYSVGALKAYRIIDKPKVSKVLNLFSLQSNKLSINEIAIPEGSILDGICYKDVDVFKKFDLIFLGMQDKELGKEFIFFSDGINHELNAQDVLIVLGSKSNIIKFKKYIGIQ